uniref:Uncharacterized protein n=1 Tax=Arundo donax TaxID=35708 RepID=A0A0A9CBN3_ARUDO
MIVEYLHSNKMEPIWVLRPLLKIVLTICGINTFQMPIWRRLFKVQKYYYPRYFMVAYSVLPGPQIF